MAVVLPALLVLVGLGLAVIAVVVAELRCLDAAAVGARLAARGEAPATVRAAVAAVAPRGAVTDMTGDGTTVTVTVRATVELPVADVVLPPLHVTRSFVEAVEPGAPALVADGGAP